MTEADWLESTDPRAMLAWITSRPERVGSLARLKDCTDRKLRLFACACLSITRSLNRQDLEECYRLAETGEGPAHPQDGWIEITAQLQAQAWCYKTNKNKTRLTCSQKAALLRDIFGNPWRRFHIAPLGHQTSTAWRADDSWDYWLPDPVLAWSDGTVPKIAQTIYEGRGPCDCTKRRPHPNGLNLPCHKCTDGWLRRDRFEEMPILADALEDAGCDDEAILRHCRGEELYPLYAHDSSTRQYVYFGNKWRPLRGPHVRGCWVLDLLLGKE